MDSVAALARLIIPEGKKEKMARDMMEIVAFADKLASAPTAGVKPAEHVVPMENVFREDIVRESYEMCIRDRHRAEHSAYTGDFRNGAFEYVSFDVHPGRDNYVYAVETHIHDECQESALYVHVSDFHAHLYSCLLYTSRCV